MVDGVIVDDGGERSVGAFDKRGVVRLGWVVKEIEWVIAYPKLKDYNSYL